MKLRAAIEAWALAPPVAGLALFFAPLACAQLASDAYESPPSVRAANILPSQILRSGHHRVRDRVTLEGDMYGFEVESDYGIYQVLSLAMLETRTHELRTLAQAISQFKQSGNEFAEQLRGQLTVNAHSFVDVITAPLNMAAQLAGNIGQTAEELGEFPSTAAARDGNPYVDAISNDSITGAHKRNVAYQLDLDVYSSNPRVQDFLNEVASARGAGYFKAGVATIRVPPSRRVKVAGGRLDAEIRNLLKNLTPRELNEGVDEQLKRLGVKADDRLEFLVHARFSPRHKTAITAHLDYLRGVENRSVLIRAALAAQSEPDAMSYETLARMLAHYHESVESVTELQFIADLPVAITQSERLLVVMPVDNIYWSRETDKVFGTLSRRLASIGHTRQELVLSGTLTQTARNGLEAYGFSHRESFLTVR